MNSIERMLSPEYVKAEFEKEYMDSPLGALNVRNDEMIKTMMRCAYMSGWITGSGKCAELFSGTPDKPKGEA